MCRLCLALTTATATEPAPWENVIATQTTLGNRAPIVSDFSSDDSNYARPFES